MTNESENHVARNAAEPDRLRGIVERLSDEQLASAVNESWTVAAVFAHMAFWDARALYLADRLVAGAPFGPDHDEPDDPDWINDSHRPLAHAIRPRDAAELALRVATDTDARIAALTPEQLAAAWPLDETSPLNPLRASHRSEHLDEIEAAVGAG